MAFDDKKIVAALNDLKDEVSKIGSATSKVLECLVNGPPTPDLLTGEKIVPAAAKQNIDETDKTKSTLILTLTVPAGAPHRDVEVVFEGDETPQKKNTENESTAAKPTKPWPPPSGEMKLTFTLPKLWQDEPGPRFVTVNIIDPAPPPPPPPAPPPLTPPPPALTMRQILPATVPKHDEDDD